MAIYTLDGVSPDLPKDGSYWIATSADVVGKVRLEKNASIWFGAVLRGDNEFILVGEGSNIQDGCVLHADFGSPLTVGENCTIGHQAMLHGCTIGANSLVGIGATILNNAVIGKNCLIGSRAFISEGKKIPDNSIVIGMPGRVMRQLDDEGVARIYKTAVCYVRNWQRFAEELR